MSGFHGFTWVSGFMCGALLRGCLDSWVSGFIWIHGFLKRLVDRPLERPVDRQFLVVVSLPQEAAVALLDLGRFPRGVEVMQGLEAFPGKPSSAPGSRAPAYGSQVNISSWPPSWNTRMPTWLTRITRPSRLACV